MVVDLSSLRVGLSASILHGESFSQSFVFRLGGVDEGRKELKAESEAC